GRIARLVLPSSRARARLGPAPDGAAPVHEREPEELRAPGEDEREPATEGSLRSRASPGAPERETWSRSSSGSSRSHTGTSSNESSAMREKGTGAATRAIAVESLVARAGCAPTLATREGRCFSRRSPFALQTATGGPPAKSPRGKP